MGKKKDQPAGPTPISQYRLGEDTLEDLDVITAFLTEDRRKKQSRADAIRAAAKEMADRIRKAKKGAKE